MKLKDNPITTPKPNAPPPPPVTLDEFRAAWVAAMAAGRTLDACAHACLEAPTAANVQAYRQAIYDTQATSIWPLIQAARGLSKADRATVEAAVGPLFTENGALTDVWRNLWLSGEHVQAWIAKRRKEVEG